MKRLNSSCLFALASLACLRPSEQRAQRDAEIGKAAGEHFAVQVAEGHAVVQGLEEEQLTLWASAPRLSMSVQFAGSHRAMELRVGNCMPGAELTASGAEIVALVASSDVPGECSFSIAATQEELELQLAPPETDELAPFSFAVLSDVQEAIVDVHDVFQVLNEQADVEFVLGAGDLTQQGTHQQLQRFQQEMKRLRVPYYTTLGNHELGQSPSNYHQYFGRGSSSFQYRGVRFTLLDSASATLDPIVYGWLEDWLQRGRSSPHVVAMHIPPLDPVGVRNGAFASRAEAAKLLGRLAQGKVDMTFYGHIHSYYHFYNAGIPAHISGGGGAIPEKFDGIGRHFLVVEAEPRAQRFEVRVVRVD